MLSRTTASSVPRQGQNKARLEGTQRNKDCTPSHSFTPSSANSQYLKEMWPELWILYTIPSDPMGFTIQLFVTLVLLVLSSRVYIHSTRKHSDNMVTNRVNFERWHSRSHSPNKTNQGFTRLGCCWPWTPGTAAMTVNRHYFVSRFFP